MSTMAWDLVTRVIIAVIILITTYNPNQAALSQAEGFRLQGSGFGGFRVFLYRGF